MNIIRLSPEQALEHWPLISPILEKARETGQGESLLVDYMRKILNGYAHCWALVDEELKLVGAGLTEILNYNQHKTLHIIAFSGVDFESQSKMFPAVEAYAKEMGCKSIEQWGRKGWAKTLPKYLPGFKEVYTVMRKDIQ